MTILVSGKNGQLGHCLVDRLNFSDLDYISLDKKEMDITKYDETARIIGEIKPRVIINTAAYTDVEKSEIDKKDAILANESGPENLSKICKKIDTPLIHISTDYVFDGRSAIPYKPEDDVNPKSFYGMSKLAGEQRIQENCDSYMIIRTSWLFSEYGKNFLKTMLKISKQKKNIDVICDQIGCPTYAGHLADAILKPIKKISENNFDSGIYHYAGDQECSWFEFTNEIFFAANNLGYIENIPNLNKILAKDFQAKAKRPNYSVLDSSKFCKVFGVNPSNWKESLPDVIKSAVLA